MGRIGFYFISIILLLLGASACGLLTGPDDEVAKDPREYTWTVDTLAFGPQTAMERIWGSSPTDVYVVGHNAKMVQGKMFHFDGDKWDMVELSTSYGGHISGYFDLSSVYGFASDDVWAVGERVYDNPEPPPNWLDSTLIIHYDGAVWQEAVTPPGRGITAIGGSGPQDIWAGGLYGTLLHYDGNAWTPDSIPLVDAHDPDQFSYFNLFTGHRADDLYGFYYWADDDGNWLLHYDGESWSLLKTLWSVVWRDIWLSPSGRLYSVGGGNISLWRDGSWERVL
ncbi:MAG: hypothetical protein ACETWG_11460 [Candidatus Neomarinimicrobiota bacterium]